MGFGWSTLTDDDAISPTISTALPDQAAIGVTSGTPGKTFCDIQVGHGLSIYHEELN
jgi:hypothetical protein